MGLQSWYRLCRARVRCSFEKGATLYYLSALEVQAAFWEYIELEKDPVVDFDRQVGASVLGHFRSGVARKCAGQCDKGGRSIAGWSYAPCER